MTRQRFVGDNRVFVLPLVLFLALAGGMVVGRAKAPVQSPAAARPAVAPRTASDCSALIQLSPPDTLITSATLVPARGTLPEYCKVLGGIEKVILFQVDLPTAAWNGKFYFAGGGGWNGSIPDLSQALTLGYAAAGTDTGHQGAALDASWAYKNEEAQINYAHRADHLVTVVAKQIVKSFYGEPERHAYFVGCSNGGKMGLMEVQRYPEDYEGVIIGNFVIDRTKLLTSFLWVAQALEAAPIPQYKIPAIERATLAACDARDGLTDGLVDRPDRCTFDPGTLLCSGADKPDCLTAGQVNALQKIYSGPTTSSGQPWYPGYAPGHEDDYANYITGFGTMNSYPSSTYKFQDGFMRYLVFQPDFDPIKDFSFDRDLPTVARLAALHDADTADLTPFKSRGGKLIMYHGWADHSIPPLRTVQYYEDIRKAHGAGADDFTRLFMVPGLHHCTSGPGPIDFGGRGQRWLRDDPDHNLVRALERWVEQGVAPNRIVGAKFVNDDPEQGIARTRPLCPWPQMARYTGSGSIDDAANFVCAVPDAGASGQAGR
jgi:feruloyl esterase